MPRVSTYLNFPRSTEVAFLFYKAVFGTEFQGPIMRFGDIPVQPGQPPIADADQNLVMHIELPILGGHVLMGTDAPESMGFRVIAGNNVSINLEPDKGRRRSVFFTLLPQVELSKCRCKKCFGVAISPACKIRSRCAGC